jgi:molybdopterin synthase catalytic subunit
VPEISAHVTAERLDVGAAIAAVTDPTCGAVAVFVGTVRESPAGEGSGPVTRLDYDAHPTLAGEKINSIASSAATRWDLAKVVAIHRSGECELGEPTVVVACSAPHRADALEACRWIIDEIKEGVPIWKREVYTDGSSWIGAN